MLPFRYSRESVLREGSSTSYDASPGYMKIRTTTSSEWSASRNVVPSVTGRLKSGKSSPLAVGAAPTRTTSNPRATACRTRGTMEDPGKKLRTHPTADAAGSSHALGCPQQDGRGRSHDVDVGEHDEAVLPYR